MNKSYLVTFATPNEKHRYPEYQKRLNETARQFGKIDEIIPWGYAKLQETNFFRDNQAILSQQFGAGYWAWKPFIILEQLKSVEDGDFVIYHDSGRIVHPHYKFERPMAPVLEWYKLNFAGIFPGGFTSHRQRSYTNRDCFVFMDCDEEKYWDSFQIAARWSVWMKSDRALDIVNKWLQYCVDQRVNGEKKNISKMPQLEGYHHHLGDQSILTNLVIKYLPHHTLQRAGREHPIGTYPTIFI